ncbi:MAG TPA: tripartite tricarboxylate transporter TctB family protein [Pseudolabrys sp.]|jgi:putative tricarboxylic transport membrane protein|nr:tripartite tricarboxylate transporter TctB family protein [Pseudolabrys sp.]
MSEGVRTPPNGGKFRFKVRGPRDFYGGVVLIALAIVAIALSGDLPGTHGFAFGPGTAPRLFAVLLAIVGALIALGGLMFDGPPLESYAVRGPAWVILAIIAFATMIRGINLGAFGIPLSIPPLGLVPSTFAAFMISIFGSTEMRWVESLIAAVAMTAFCVALFVYLLQLPFQLWPWI